MTNEAHHAESAEKSELSTEEQLKRLRSEEYFAEQRNIQTLLLKNEKTLGNASKIFYNRRILGEKLIGAVRQMMANGMDTFPEYKKNDTQDTGSPVHALAVEDAREIVRQIDSEWKEYDERDRDDVGRLFGVMDTFAATYQLDFNPHFRERVDADILWEDLQKAYEVRLFELQNDIKGKEHNFRDI